MLRLKFSRLARGDLRDIGDFIKERDPAAARRWIELIERKSRSLAANPGLVRRRPEFGAGFRSLAIGSYVIFYRPVADGVEIVRVLHGRRDLRTALAGRH